MLPCKHCNTPNTLDSTFCKKCGAGIQDDDLRLAREKLEKLIQEGVTGLNEGRVQEAMAIAESAVTADPSSVAAWSLKANCHERYGQIPEALECAEKVVDLNPDSELDKIKRSQLRSALMAQAQSMGPRSQRYAFAAATAVVGILICLAVIVGRTIKPRPQDNGGQTQNLVARNGPAADYAGQTQPQYGQQQTAAEQSGGNPQQGAQSAEAAPTGGSSQEEPVSDDPSSRSSASSHFKGPGSLPPIDPNSLQIGPVVPNAPTTQKGTTPPSAGGSGDPPAPVDNGPSTISTDGGGKVSITSAEPAKDDPGQIQITVHRNGPGRIGNSGVQPVDSSAGGAQAFANTANEQYLIGNYVGASSNLEKAIHGGGNPITLNQLLAQSYEHQGLKTEAVNAYQRCIDACNSALASGRGNTAKAQKAKDVCQDAIKLLQGG